MVFGNLQERKQTVNHMSKSKALSGQGMPAAWNKIFCFLFLGQVPRFAHRFHWLINLREYQAVFLMTPPQFQNTPSICSN